MDTLRSFTLVLFVSSASTSGIKKGSTSKRLCMVMRVSMILWLKTPCFPPGFFINFETCTRNFKVDIVLMTKHPVNTCMLEQIQLKDRWKLNAGILLPHNFTSCKGFSWITSGPPPQKQGNSCRIHVSFSLWNWHFFPKKLNNAHSWSSISKNKMWIIYWKS